MQPRQMTTRRWALALACLLAMVLAVGCGRVDLEDLTPEAVRTSEAATATYEAANPQPTSPSGSSGTPGASGSPGSGGEIEGDIAGGASLYNAHCSGCHEGGRAASLKGKTFDPAVEIPKLRTGEGFGVPHPAYTLTEIAPLSDSDLTDIFAYLAAQ
jgi:mono/diheme cytochrome c family protein